MATMYSPTAGIALEKVAAGRGFELWTLITAMSVSGSRPTILASSFSPVASVTVMLVAVCCLLSGLTTMWLLVSIVPSLL